MLVNLESERGKVGYKIALVAFSVGSIVAAFAIPACADKIGIGLPPGEKAIDIDLTPCVLPPGGVSLDLATPTSIPRSSWTRQRVEWAKEIFQSKDPGPDQTPYQPKR